MKYYLTGPRAGKTEVLCGIQFVDGVAELPSRHPILEKYYGAVLEHIPVAPTLHIDVVDTFDKEGFDKLIKDRQGMIINMIKNVVNKGESNGLQKETKEEVSTQNGNDSTQIENDSPHQVEDDDSTLLSQIVEQKKRELENKVELTPLEKFDSLKTWGEKRSYVRSITGILPKDKAQAMELLGVK